MPFGFDAWLQNPRNWVMPGHVKGDVNAQAVSNAQESIRQRSCPSVAKSRELLGDQQPRGFWKRLGIMASTRLSRLFGWKHRLRYRTAEESTTCGE